MPVTAMLGCKDCPAVYVGETTRTAEQRAKEHRDHTNKGRIDMSAIAKHAVETGHDIHWQPEFSEERRKTPNGRCAKRLS